LGLQFTLPPPVGTLQRHAQSGLGPHHTDAEWCAWDRKVARLSSQAQFMPNEQLRPLSAAWEVQSTGTLSDGDHESLGAL
jgi:hypothetical protein